MSKEAFDKQKLDNALNNLKNIGVRYVIGIDHGDTISSYCLVRFIGDKIDVVLSKTSSDKDDFESEVDNIVKYFNAIKLQEKNE